MTRRYRLFGILIYLSMAASLILYSDVSADTAYTMVNDYRFYTYSEYRAKRQHHYALQVKVIDDRRPRPRAERKSQGKSLMATDDTFWMEPIPEMVERILFREFALSFLFRKVGREDMRSGLILELVLNSFHGHTERTGILARLIYGDVAFSARLVQQKPRKTLFTKNYHSRNSVKLKSITKSGRRIMVEQIGKSLEQLIPALVSDIERVLSELRPPKKTRISRRKKPKPVNLEPVGPR